MNNKFAQISVFDIAPTEGPIGPRGIAPTEGPIGPRNK